jgi:hypothetical protein
MSEPNEKFWVDDPCVLFKNLKIFPLPHMTNTEKLNALTRLTVVISGTLYVLEYEYWSTFLVLSVATILVLKYALTLNKDPKGDGTGVKEDFTLVPTYANPDYHTTTVAPVIAEEWQMYPQTYDLYENQPLTPLDGATFQEPLNPQSYPFNQYLTRSNLLPSDEYATHMLNGGPRQAREYINTSFLRHDMAHREEMTRLYKKKLAKRYRHNGSNDNFSPYSSY